MTHYYPYLNDKEFLRELDAHKNKEVYLRITVLDIQNNPIQTIEGKATGGSLNRNGSSNVRISGSVSLVADDTNYQIQNIDNIISLNKKVDIEIGYENVTSQYSAYNTIWFPQGIMCITQPSITHNTSSFTLSLTLKDQMALLNGDLGGTLPAAVTFSPLIKYDDEGNSFQEPTLIQDIIYTLVNELGDIPKDKIFIRDIDNRITNICSWSGVSPVYLIKNGYNNNNKYKLSLIPPEGEEADQQYSYGDLLGQTNRDFVYPGTLSANPGESIASVLDKIKNTLGNFEYFFDYDGNFIFQEIKNYLNDGNEIDNITELVDTSYFTDRYSNKSVYEFDNTNLITSVQISPQYTKIKNDFNIWGKKNNRAIRYHLVIDNLPIVPQNKLFRHIHIETNEKRYGGNPFLVQKTTGGITIFSQGMDWRVYLYLDYICGGEKNYYSEELFSNLPFIVDFTNDKWDNPSGVHYWQNSQFRDNPANYPYFLDIIDSSNPNINQFNVSKIGRKTAIIKQDSVNCMFSFEEPDRILLSASTSKTADEREEAGEKLYIQVAPAIWNLINQTVTNYSAFECLRGSLHDYISYNENISISCLPIYHIEPNTRITIKDKDTDLCGDYMIKTMSVPLTANGTMSITAQKALERL